MIRPVEPNPGNRAHHRFARFQWEQGRWKLYGISIEPRAMAGTQPDPAPAPVAQPAGKPKKP